MKHVDSFLISPPLHPELKGVGRFLAELGWFGLKEVRACLFAGLFFLAMFIVPRNGVGPFPRYDLLLIIALVIQFLMVFFRLETWDELKAITIFHLAGFLLELFKTSPSVASWSYPDFAWTKVMGVPLFSGFMYAAIGSYIIQAWRLFDLRIRHHPPIIFAVLISLLIYLNFFTHHYIGDYRWYIAALALGLYARTEVIFTTWDKQRRMPLLLGFLLIGFFIWLAENISTLLGVWRYPNQLGAWSMVHVGKWSSWSLLVIMSFTLTLFLKGVKKRIHIAS